MFYSRFVKLCVREDKSVSAALDEMGLPHSAATRWKHGAKPRATTLQKVADYFAVPVEELIDPPGTDDQGETTDPLASTENARTEVMMMLARTSDEKLARELPRLRELLDPNS